MVTQKGCGNMAKWESYTFDAIIDMIRNDFNLYTVMNCKNEVFIGFLRQNDIDTYHSYITDNDMTELLKKYNEFVTDVFTKSGVTSMIETYMYRPIVEYTAFIYELQSDCKNLIDSYEKQMGVPLVDIFIYKYILGERFLNNITISISFK
jgi:hypothetical protein